MPTYDPETGEAIEAINIILTLPRPALDKIEVKNGEILFYVLGRSEPAFRVSKNISYPGAGLALDISDFIKWSKYNGKSIQEG